MIHVSLPEIRVSVPEQTILEASGDPLLPEMSVIEQVWNTDPILSEKTDEYAAHAVRELSLDDLLEGGEVALGAGSRGVANLAPIVSGVTNAIVDAGYEPFVFPAMGSHGGATGAGQRKISTSYT